MLFRNNLSLDSIVGHIEATGDLLRRGLLRFRYEGQREYSKNGQSAGVDGLDFFHGLSADDYTLRGLLMVRNHKPVG
jgi:hypothetical protein